MGVPKLDGPAGSVEHFGRVLVPAYFSGKEVQLKIHPTECSEGYRVFYAVAL